MIVLDWLLPRRNENRREPLGSFLFLFFCVFFILLCVLFDCLVVYFPLYLVKTSNHCSKFFFKFNCFFGIPPFTLFEVERKVYFCTIKFVESSFGKTPKVLNSVYVNSGSFSF